MGLIQPGRYRKLNRETNLFEWVNLVEYSKKDTFKPINVKTPKKRKRK
jgi:hypothetical protein